MAETWQDKTDNTLGRIEGQLDDDTSKQTGFALDFREKVITSLTKIEGALEQNDKDHKEIKEVMSKIPKIEIGLNNHLRTHDDFKTKVYYPILVLLIIAALGTFAKLVLHIF